MKRVLLVTYHFPPALGSGVQRMLALAQYLPEHDWQVDVLTVSRNVFDASNLSREEDIPRAGAVLRAPTLDVARHLSIKGRYPLRLALPDRWASWTISGVLTGLRYIRRTRPDAIMSSFPIASAHLLAARLAHTSGVPWLADFRDPMCQDEYPKDPRVWRSLMKIEKRTFAAASGLSFTSPGAIRYYRKRYPERSAADFKLVANGYDENLFTRISASQPAASGEKITTLLHSGLLYPWERDPLPFFAAVAELEQLGFWRQHPVRIVLRASGYDTHYAPIIASLGLSHLVELRPALPYGEALAEICGASGLLLLQAANSNFQIPAKTYEYLRSGRPILGLLDPAGDSAALLREAGIETIAAIDSQADIARMLRCFVEGIAEQTLAGADRALVAAYSRRTTAAQTAAILDTISS